jgi:hypothetical protein
LAHPQSGLGGAAMFQLLRGFALVAVAAFALTGCKSPSDNEVTACVTKKIIEQTDYSLPHPIICNELIAVLSAKTADNKTDGSSARVIADVIWRAKREFGKSSYSASVCFVSAADYVSYYKVDEVSVSKVEVDLEKWASGWKCKN